MTTFRPATAFITLISDLGLTSGLKLCLDAGDSSSYSGTGQSWLDRSGNGYDFFRGTTSAAQATDPTFNGSAGGLSANEYWSFDGGDLFRYDTTNETWMQNLHKNNALYTIAMWHFTANNANQRAMFGNNGASALTDVGFDLILSATFRIGTDIFNGSGSTRAHAATISAAGAGTAAAWNFYAVSLDEAAGANGCILQANGVQELFDATYTTPSAANATRTTEIGAAGNSALPQRSGDRIGFLAAWEGVALTASQLNALYRASWGRAAKMHQYRQRRL